MIREIEPFREKHVEDAARLFADRFRVERSCSPLLPSRCEVPDAIVPLLRGLIDKSPGVVAISGKRLTGFLIGLLLPSWRGRRSIYVPEYGHAEGGDQRAAILQQMYAHLSSEWVANGCFTHLFTVLAQDRQVVDSLFWLGFGMAAVDALRDVGEVEGPFADVEIRRAGLGDLPAVRSLSDGYWPYMAGPPIFAARSDPYKSDDHAEWLSNPANALWLAAHEGETLSYMKIGPLPEPELYILTDEGTAGIAGAFTSENARGKGIGAALLRQCVNWARTQGFTRCAVDFEPENALGSSFWLKHFKPVCYSLIRRVDERMAWIGRKSG